MSCYLAQRSICSIMGVSPTYLRSFCRPKKEVLIPLFKKKEFW